MGHNLTTITTRWVICLLVFYLPGVFFIFDPPSPHIYNSLEYYEILIVRKIPELLFYLTFFDLRRGGLRMISFKEILVFIAILLLFAIIYWLYTTMSIKLELPGVSKIGESTEGILTHAHLLPFAFFSMILVGYTEEILFRAIGIPAVTHSGRSPHQAVIATTIVFVLFHLHQQYMVGITLIFGFILGLLFIRFKNIHLNAWIHGIWNFSLLLLSYLHHHHNIIDLSLF